MPRQYLRYTWVSSKLASGKSKIHGNGVFATQKIVRGKKVMIFGGEFISREQAFSGNYRSRSIWPVDSGHYLVLPKSDTQESFDEYINHSCDANTWLDDEVTLSARRDIEIGEEITLDQGTWNFEDSTYTDNQMPCSCGAADCRLLLTENDWKISDVQKRYSGHFHPLVQKLIESN